MACLPGKIPAIFFFAAFSGYGLEMAELFRRSAIFALHPIKGLQCAVDVIYKWSQGRCLLTLIGNPCYGWNVGSAGSRCGIIWHLPERREHLIGSRAARRQRFGVCRGLAA